MCVNLPLQKSGADSAEPKPGGKPPFTLSQLREAIPLHCFQRCLFRSLWYLFYDLSVVFTLYYVATTFIPLLPSQLRYLAWPVYWAAQGTAMSAAWALAHDCGHHSFSDLRWLNTIIGFSIHSTFLVPYFSFQHSHALHHARTGSLEMDEAYLPRHRHTESRSVQWFFGTHVGRAMLVVGALLIGWPLWIGVNFTGRSYNRFTSRVDPWSPMFPPKKRLLIILSDVGLLVVCYFLYLAASARGSAWLLLVYGAPLLVVNGYFVAVTFLQHVHPSLPHYDDAEWSWLRGALSTADRDWGLLNRVLHHATDAHVVHHLFASIPHYHLEEAREAIIPILGDYYVCDKTPILKALYRETKCIYVKGSQGIYWYDVEDSKKLRL